MKMPAIFCRHFCFEEVVAQLFLSSGHTLFSMGRKASSAGIVATSL